VALPGSATAGDAVAGDAVAGDAVAGDAVAGDAVAGDAVASIAAASATPARAPSRARFPVIDVPFDVDRYMLSIAVRRHSSRDESDVGANIDQPSGVCARCAKSAQDAGVAE
jgi:hypothetical protein